MKYRKKVLQHVEVKETYKPDKTICDFCGKNVDDVARAAGNGSEDIEIKAEIGNIWEGGEADVRDGYSIDSCSDCFVNKVKPALEAIGGTWTEYRPEEGYIYNSYSDLYKTI